MLKSDCANRRDSIVTGGGSGIGRATCRALAANGVVGVLDCNVEGAKRTVELIEAAGGRAIALRADVTDWRSVTLAFDTFEGEGGAPEVVVACAGVERVGTILDEPEENWDLVMAVNAKGVYLTARAAFKRFVERRQGNFVAIASDAGVLGTSGFGIYTASKHAVVGLVKALALDFGPLGIRSNAICPGNVRTPMMDAYFAEAPEEADYWTNIVPMGRFAEPDEIAAGGGLRVLAVGGIHERQCASGGWGRIGWVLQAEARGRRLGTGSRERHVATVPARYGFSARSISYQ